MKAKIEKVLVAILAQDEERNIAHSAGAASRFFDHVLVIDGGSRDRTEQVARDSGADVVRNTFKGFSEQRNFAISVARKRGFDWLLFLDADEVISRELTENIDMVTHNPPARPAAFRMRRINRFLSRPLRRATGSDRQTRLFFSLEGLAYRGAVHESAMGEGRILCPIPGEITHMDLGNVESLIAKINRYTTLEVERRGGGRLLLLALRLCFRPAWVFLRNFILRGGFVDGWRGLIWNALNAFYEALVILKQMEREIGGRSASGGDG